MQPKHGSRILAVSWQFDHAEARGPCSLAYSLHAKKALTHCLCRQVKSRQWSAPLASSTGATEARILSPHSRSLPSTQQSGLLLSCGAPLSPQAQVQPKPIIASQRSGLRPFRGVPLSPQAQVQPKDDFFTDTFTSSCLACHVVSESFDRSDYCWEMWSPRSLSCLRWEFRN